MPLERQWWSFDVDPTWAFNMNWLPSGYVKIAIENGHRNSGFTHEQW
jgi:hypothetical protein